MLNRSRILNPEHPILKTEHLNKEGPMGEGLELEGKALQIYVLLVAEGRPLSVREIQTKLSLSSPSVAHYHLRKLVRMGLLAKNKDGHYYVRRLVKVGVLRDFLFVGRYAIPRYVFYSAFFLSLFVFCAIAFIGTSDPGLFFLTLSSLAIAAFSWLHEAFRVIRGIPGR